ncbi:MAG: TrkH family potassium uptake protein, partial [Acidobacteriota bacterium]
VGLTSLEALLLLFGGMPWLEAIDHSLTTLATGGFSPRNASIGAYDSAYLRGVIMFFMLCAGTNFVLHFRLLRGRWRDVARDGELRWFLSLLLLFAAPIALVLIGAGQTLGSSVEDALFTVISLVTTTGYGTVDFEQWPIVLHGLLIPLLIFGGMAGSTGGGVKTLRTLIAFRAIRMSFRQMLHPHALTPVTYRGQRVPFDVLDGIWGFFAVYFLIALIGMLVINVAGADLVTAWSASLTAIGNVGPGLGDVGPSDNFGWLPGYAKWALTALMLCGRLEVYTVVLLLLPGFWRR